MTKAYATLILLLAAIHISIHAEAVKDREGAVRGDRETMIKDARWIYNDIDKGFAEAGKSGKPLLVVIRCVPCKACMGIDASILNSKELQPLLEKFVCVRVINANALDLTKFQFDYDLSFSTLLFNADGTLYGRYGSWQHQKDIMDSTTIGYKAALDAVLEIHAGYPGNKAVVAGKQGGPAPFKIPVEIPTLAGKYEKELNWGGQVVKSCVHCHQIGDAFRAYYRNQGKAIPADLIYPMPAPETVGLTLDTEFVAKVSAVAPGSAAAAAGLAKGDEIVSVEGQRLISIADFAWCLHRSPEKGELKLSIKRAGESKEVTLALKEGWRMKTDISSRVGTWPMRAMATGGLVLTELPAADREKRGIDEKSLGLLVKFVGMYGPHGEAKKAGFLKDDVLLSVEGVMTRMNESELIGYLLTTHTSKDKLKTTVLRGDKRVELLLPMQ